MYRITLLFNTISFFLLQQNWMVESKLERIWFENTIHRITENLGQSSGLISSLKQVDFKQKYFKLAALS